ADPNIEVGITAAVAAVAETGSLLITGENRNQLCASLLPEIHIAILQARDIHKSLEEVLALPEIRNAPAASLISGPSRTADIEMTLTIGVHGPRELIVFLVDG
ncbi:MAG: LUD domain-containing protein, partial [Anaerolineales bacterium]|nr:LUD domain-containing protein [Anaerolineales bacterium]